jgi:hypothetical protein
MTVHFLPPEGDAEVYSILQIKDHFTMTLKRGKHGPFSVLHKKRKWLID